MHFTTRGSHHAARRAGAARRGAAARAVSDPAFDPALTVRLSAAPVPRPRRAPSRPVPG